MSATNRRIAIAQLAVGTAALQMWSRASARTSGPLPIPDRPLRLVRAVDHTFLDQSHLSVFRSWHVKFERSGQGVNVSGEAAEVSVQASPSLAGFTEAERARSTAGMWPIRLSSAGLILAMGSDGEASNGFAASSVVLNSLPDDLFYPSFGPLESVETIELPHGTVGEFALHYEARRAPDHPWLDRAERRIITRIGGTQETAVERWRLMEL